METKSQPFGIYIIVLLIGSTLLMAGVFYYSLTQRHQFQAEASALLRTKFLQTLIAREGQPVWRTSENTLPLNYDTWDFHVNGRLLEVAVRTPIPVENQASLSSEIINTVRLVLDLDPKNSEIEVIYRNSAKHHQ